MSTILEYDLATQANHQQAPTARNHPCGPLDLHWLPLADSWVHRLKTLVLQKNPSDAWGEGIELAKTRIDFIRTGKLDRVMQRMFSDTPPPQLATKPERLAILSSSTVTQLVPSLRTAALRRGIWLRSYECAYGQYLQELMDRTSALHQFQPSTILFAFDAYHLMRGLDAAADATQAHTALIQILDTIKECWRLAREQFGCTIIQQTVLPIFPCLLGNNEHRLHGSRHGMVRAVNSALREITDEAGVDLLAADTRAAQDGVTRWHDPVLWHRAKQEVSPVATPIYGDLVGRMLAAKQGRSYKCLVLDLDNTLWGGVIGDDGLDDIVLGQGSASGEAFVAFQTYVRDLAKRGIIIAVCSKNDEANALSPFDKHPDMVLRKTDIACFVANWQDKVANIRTIAHRLNIGLDSLVFVDDNPFERNLVRQELPMVAVPEVSDDPATFATSIADAGYFEGLAITNEDRERTKLYHANIEREAMQTLSADLPSYLRGLQMELVCQSFDEIGLQRIVQLINKTNQFNLTTRRYTEEEVRSIMRDSDAFGMQFRLTDRFGDNGVIAIVIGRRAASDDILLDTWLMSCRVLGRQVEKATLAVIVEEARRLGGRRLIGEFRPTAKNAMVKDHYARLNFEPLGTDQNGTERHQLNLLTYTPADVFITICKK